MYPLFCYFTIGWGAECCNERVCMSISLPSHIVQKAHIQTSQTILYIYFAMAQSSSDDSAIRYVIPGLWITSCLAIIGQAEAMFMLKVTHQGAELGAKSDV